MPASANGLYEDVCKVLQGRRFDTAKAEFVGRTQVGQTGPLGVIDFHHFEEALYRTLRSKRFFLAGRGGALTKYGRNAPYEDQGQIAGERIIPLTDDEAYAWAAEHLDPIDLEEWFADRIEDA